jgi:hypothetical protein
MTKHVITIEIELDGSGDKSAGLQSIIEDVTAYLVDGYGPDSSTATENLSRGDGYPGPYITAIGEATITH